MAESAPQLQPAPRRTARQDTAPVEPLWRHMLGDRLRALRHDRGETLGETAARAGVSPQYLSEMERGAKEPSSEMIAAVAGALGVTLLDLTIGVAEGLRASRPAAQRSSGGRATVALAA
jgi:transcriptional regulator with XRE-family HTH domain